MRTRTLTTTFALGALALAGFLTSRSRADTPPAANTAPAAAAAALKIRFVVPAASGGGAGPGASEAALAAVVGAYNDRLKAQARPGQAPIQVQLIRRGSAFSSIQELISLYLAGDPPEIAAVESSELPTLARTHLQQKIPADVARLASTPAGNGHRSGAAASLPFERALPVLVVDQERLFRVHADAGPWPRDWSEVVKLAERSHGTIALPLEGARGLWIFEALAGKPLWSREAGGLRANRELGEEIARLQRLLPPITPALAGPEMSWERALQDFLDRKSPLLVTTLDALPQIAGTADFRWKAGLLPGATPLSVSGSELVVTRDRLEIWDFLRYLYSKEVAAQWCVAGGFLPLKGDWQQTAAFRGAPEAYRQLVQQVSKTPAKAMRARSSDTDAVRAHSEWISALHYLFGEPGKRLATENVLTQLDSVLAH